MCSLQNVAAAPLGHLGDLLGLGPALHLLDDGDRLLDVGEVHGGELGVDHGLVNSHLERGSASNFAFI